MVISDFQKTKLPDNPGVYYFKKGKSILYVGKATSLKDRVRSYFSSDLVHTRGQRLVAMVEDATTISYKETPSVLEALILEAYEIKKHQPYYNSQEKDDKSYNYVVITDEAYPRVLVERGRNLFHDSNQKKVPYKIKTTFGPFPNGSQLREALKIVRRLFPYRDKCTPLYERLASKGSKLKAITPCFNRQIGLCPGVCTGEITQKQYAKTIKNIELFFSGKTDAVRKNLTSEMKAYAKQKEFEKAEVVKRTLFALDHIKDVSLIKSDQSTINHSQPSTDFRIEAYDIAHISGTSTVGAMVVHQDGELAKQEYRKFTMVGEKGLVSVDDTKNLRELLTRRLKHTEWTLPNLIVLDGGIAQRNVAEAVLKEHGFNVLAGRQIEIASVVKDDRHKAREIVGKNATISRFEKEILLVNAEAHRFAIAFHRLRRKKDTFK